VVCDSRFQIVPGSVHCPFGGLHSAFCRALGLGGWSSQTTSGRKKKSLSKGSPIRGRDCDARGVTSVADGCISAYSRSGSAVVRKSCALGNMVPGRSCPAGAVPSIVGSKCSATALPPRPPATVNASSPRWRWTLAVSERRFAQFDLVGPGDVSTNHDRMHRGLRQGIGPGRRRITCATIGRRSPPPRRPVTLSVC
jgi:hypothetical protein